MSESQPENDGDHLPKPVRLSPEVQASLRCYWRSNVKLMVVLLLVWAVVGLGCGVLFADALNAFQIGGYPVGFWFAQQGSIVIFVLLILIYAMSLNGLDAKHHAEIESLRKRSEEASK